jgi:hypothetical protein
MLSFVSARLARWRLGLLLVLPWMAATTRAQPQPPAAPMTSGEREAFLLQATIVGEATLAKVRRVSLSDGQRAHEASVETSTSPVPSQPDYRSNVAAYELDKLLGLDLVSPSVKRTVNGQPAALTWWVDDVLMAEVNRRRQGMEPPDLGRWTQQMQAVRLFDELIDNAYRDMSPASYTSTLWDNLLITREWRIWLIDHKCAFGVSRRLKYPETLTQCDRRVLASVRGLSSEALKGRLGSLLTADQLDALETRRALIARHFEERIAQNGERAVLYDLPPRR